jgi:hypothetical protein
MKLISENVEEVQYITEASEDGKKNLFIEGIFLQGGIKNKNGRIYPVSTLANEVNRYNESYISKKRAFGELNHPSGPTINLDKVSHIITELKQSGNNFVGKAKIIDTPMGNIARNIIESGGQLGVSSRGMGTLKVNSQGINEVQDDFQLATAADIVSNPSAPEAWVNGIMEGVEFWFDNQGNLHKEEAAILAKKQINEAVEKRQLQERKVQIFGNYLNSIMKSKNNK